jgi:glycosyltransferase involved in cell wall biosynthesis
VRWRRAAARTTLTWYGSAVTVSVLVPISDQGSALREQLLACLRAISGLDVELVLLDNQSIDGCCHGLPPGVLIVRTERDEPPARLLWMGESLARGGSLLWLPAISALAPGRFRALVSEALAVAPTVRDSQPGSGPPPVRFAATWDVPSLLTRDVRSRLEGWRRIPAFGRVLSAAAQRWLPMFIPLGTAKQEHEPPNGTRDRQVHFGSVSARHVSPRLSVIITAHNEGAEVPRTVDSVRSNTAIDHEIIVVDDGSTDGSCNGLEAMDVRVVRHSKRVGVAYSRDAGSSAATGDVFAYFDGHQRVEPGCLDRCAELAAAHAAIICPPCRPLNRAYPVSYGASFSLCAERGFFSGRYRTDCPRQEVSRISGLRAPGYVIPRSVYPKVRWVAGLRGWGATDYAVALKAFFTDVDILHVRTRPTEHLFRKAIPYDTSWAAVWRNHALIARVCFDDRTWNRYWLPEVFQANLEQSALDEMNSPAVLAEQEAFMALKVRPDREFWRGLLRIPEPKALT